jgi:coproporphyrinogen III oxidase
LLSMPPLVSWSYQRSDAADSAEAELTQRFLVRRDWLTDGAGAIA